MTKTLCLILGDQLSLSISSLSDFNFETDSVLMAEVLNEATYVKHHKKKIAYIFSAMRHFAEDLIQSGFKVEYVKLDNANNTGSFFGEVSRAFKFFKPDRIVVTEPSEYRVLKDMKSWENQLSVPIEFRPDDRFLYSPSEFAKWAKGRKQLRMEYFYREVRKKFGILMDGKNPEGGQWNFDSQNRKPPPKDLSVPKTFNAKPDQTTVEVMKLVAAYFPNHFGDLEPFHFAVTRNQALEAMEQFFEERLASFGDYQDAMVQGEPWLYHSHLSFYINSGLLTPLEVVSRAEHFYKLGKVPLNAVEGFIRQIIGWREYVRGIYWLEMPTYETKNYLGAKRKLPNFFWGGDTKMNCLGQTVKETKQNAYAHHIQRLMIIGNFALIAGLSPKDVNEWFLIVYADAYQWVELPNVLGMGLFADGGILGSKPYASSGAYINKMSNYCKGCEYKVTQKSGLEACPFNYLYWDFLVRNKDKLANNPRLFMIYKTLDRMAVEKVETIINDSKHFLKALDKGEIV